MKKALTMILTVALCLLLVMQALAAGGTEEDPVISYSYLQGTLKESLIKDLQDMVDAYGSAKAAKAFELLAEQSALYNRTNDLADTSSKSAQTTLLLKAGDVLTLGTGAQVTLVYGKASANTRSLINVTDGRAHASGAALTNNKRYMQSTDAAGGIVIESETAEVYIDGVYTLAYSSSIDYASMADGLYEMGLFAGTVGSVTGYGLEQSCTRIESVVMFLRLIGKIDEAAAYTGTHPFTDVYPSHWAYRYLAYAYANNLAYGISSTKFAPSQKVSAQDYVTFLLRALGYVDFTDFEYKTVLQDCVTLGVFSKSEIQAMNTGNFLRSRMVYLSYYALYATEQESRTSLLFDLIDQGCFTLDQAIAGACKVSGGRIS